MNCQACGAARLDAAQRFCGACGAPYAVAPPGPQAPPGSALAVPVAPGSQGMGAATARPWTRNPNYGFVSPIAPRIGPMCPTCGSMAYVNYYSFWHAIVTLLAFPFGAFILLAPVRVCENGHRYGLGIWTIRLAQTLAGLVLCGIVIFIWLVVSTAHDFAHMFGS